MPLIDVRLSVPVSQTQEEELVKQIGKAIIKIPGKEEASLMVQVQGNCPLWFQGKKQPCAHVTVKIAGQADKQDFNRFNAAVSQALQPLGVPGGAIYFTNEESEKWNNGLVE